MEGDFILQSIAQQGREANERFESRLKASAPLEVLLECEDSDEELRKMMEDMHRRYADEETNPWKAETFQPADEPVLSIQELEKKFSAPENPWDAPAARVTDADQDEETEQTDPPQLPDRTTRYERHVTNMKASILSRMQDGASRATAVAELLKIAGANTYSRQVVRDAEMQTPE